MLSPLASRRELVRAFIFRTLYRLPTRIANPAVALQIVACLYHDLRSYVPNRILEDPESLRTPASVCKLGATLPQGGATLPRGDVTKKGHTFDQLVGQHAFHLHYS